MRAHSLIRSSVCATLVVCAACDLSRGDPVHDEVEPVASIVPVVPGTEVERAELELRPMEGRWFYAGQPYSGWAVRRYRSGEVSERVGFVEGRREGAATLFYPDGSLRKRSRYRDNRLEGVVEFWSASGVLMASTHYARGIKHGEERRWYEDGAPFKHRNLVNGREHGMQRAWRRNGKLYVNYEARHGRVFGLKRSTLCFSLEDERVKE